MPLNFKISPPFTDRISFFAQIKSRTTKATFKILNSTRADEISVFVLAEFFAQGLFLNLTSLTLRARMEFAPF
nr:hypothetical protein [uncultured Campylobacter sp.]